MRCESCDEPLSDYEATRRSVVTMEYINLCNECVKRVGAENLLTIDRPDLRHQTDDIVLTDDEEGIDFIEDYDDEDEEE